MTEPAHHTPRLQIVYLAPDSTDSAVRKRAHGFLSAGHDLVSFSFRRARYREDFQPDWPDIPLGQSKERQLLARILLCWRALWVIVRHGRLWREADVVYVRNLDLAVLGMVGKRLTRSPSKFVFEVLDVHPALARSGLRTRLLRWLERCVLRRCDLLVVSSPAFLQHYFLPIQQYQGKSFVLENRWPSACLTGQSRRVSYRVDSERPRWTIGWLGNIRCRQSLRMLAQLADALPDRVEVRIRGCVSLLGEDILQEVIGVRANMVFEGEYAAPEDLGRVYAGIHFNWCVDLDDGDNSRWLLPNRLYEGGYFGVPALAIDEHETGRLVRERRLGIAVAAPFTESLQKLLGRLSTAEYRDLRADVESQPLSHFVDSGDISALTWRAIQPSPGADKLGQQGDTVS